MVYTVRFFSSKCNLFHNFNIFGSCIIQILYTGRAKIRKNYSGAKRLSFFVSLKIVGLILFEVFNPYPANVENMVSS